jgi:exopolysaccharide production protein ExoQ
MCSSLHRPMDLRRPIACGTLVIAPILAFQAFPLPGIVTLAMTLPLIVLASTYFTTTDNRVPLWELALLALLASSVLWGDDPNYSVERLRTYLPLLLATTFASCLVSGKTVLRCLELSVAVIVGSSLFYIFLDPAGAVRQNSLELDVTAQFAKNTYGGLLAIALLLTIGHKRRINLLLMGGLVALLAVNRCVTAWVVVTFLVFATYASRHLIDSMGPRSKSVLAVLGLASVGGAAILGLFDAAAVVAALGKDLTLSSRTEIWAACWQQIKLAPLFGHGAFTFLEPASNSPVTQYVSSRFHNYQPPHPHNGFLDLVGQLGVVGVVVFAGLVLHGLRRGARASLLGAEWARTATVCLSFILLFGITEPTYLGPWLVVTIMCLAITDSRGSVTESSPGGPSETTVQGEARGGNVRAYPSPRAQDDQAPANSALRGARA